MKQTFYSLIIILNSYTLFAQNVMPQLEILNYPQIGEISESELGNSLVALEKKETYEGFKLENRVFAKAMLGSLVINPTDLYFVMKTKNALFFKCVNRCIETYDRSMKEKRIEYTGGIAISTGGMFFHIYIDDAVISTEKLKYKIDSDDPVLISKPVSLIKDPIFKQEFIYNGKVGNAIKFIYREFNDGLARPSFTQEVQYDLTEENIIGLKGMKMEIIKATNSTIHYKVIKHFSGN